MTTIPVVPTPIGTDATIAASARLVRPSAFLAPRLLGAIVAGDPAELRRLLADDVWLRAMLVRETVERHDADTAVELVHGWFFEAAELQVLHTDWWPVTTREHLVYRLRLRPAWAPDVWHVIEQTGYLRAQGGRIRRLDLVCTGFVPERDLRAGGDEGGGGGG